MRGLPSTAPVVYPVTDLAAGDFVRWAKQVIDSLDQLAKIPDLPRPLARRCHEAVDAVRRGVVAYSSVAD